MDNLRHTLSISVIIVMLLSILVVPGNGTNMVLDLSATPSAIEIPQVLTNPNFETEPNAFVNGSSGEFSYSYIGQTMQLNWTHVENTELDFHSDDDYSYPSYNDFVYFTQSFDWPYEEMPEDAEFNLTYCVTVSGGFYDDPAGQSMFKLYIWLIDSSGNWDNAYESYPPYISVIQSRRIDLNYIDLLEGWRGMIEDATGVQEDPTDTLTVGIGLAPTADFVSSLANGSVLVEVDSVFLHVVMQVEPDPATHLTPLYNKTFGSTISQVIPRFIGDSTPVSDDIEAMTQDPDGNLYITGYTGTPYEWYQENGVWSTRQYLIKYNPVLDRMWLVRNDNLTRGFAITYHEGHLYTSGMFYGYEPDYYNLMLTKWTAGGQKVWEKEWGGLYDQIGVALGVHNDGSIYVVVADHNIRSEPAFQNSSIMKFDSSGNVLWNRPLQLCTIFDVPGKMWVFESHIIYYIQSTLLCMDLEGNLLWQGALPAYACYCTTNDTIYAVEPSGAGFALHRYNLEGNDTLLTYYELEYPNGWLEVLTRHSIALTLENEIIVLVQGQMHDYSYHLLKFDLDGTLLHKWSIGNERWPWPGGPPHLLEVTSTGLAYFGFIMAGSWDVCVQAYAIGNYTLPYLGPDTLTIVAIGGGIGVVVLIGVYVYKKKKV